MKQILRLVIDLAPLIQAAVAILICVFIVKQTGISKQIQKIANRQSAMFHVQLYFYAKNEKLAIKQGNLYQALRKVSRDFEEKSEEDVQRLLHTIFD